MFGSTGFDAARARIYDAAGALHAQVIAATLSDDILCKVLDRVPVVVWSAWEIGRLGKFGSELLAQTAIHIIKSELERAKSELEQMNESKPNTEANC